MLSSDAEERDCLGQDRGVYNVPSFGSLSYGGVAGFTAIFEQIAINDNLGHPFCDNLRQGFWAFDYLCERLFLYSNNKLELKSCALKISDIVNTARSTPTSLRPLIFGRIIFGIYRACLNFIYRQWGQEVSDCSLMRLLALCSVELIGEVPSTSLHPIRNGYSFAAGLPHFATHHMRSWGRDVFISLPGMLIRTGRLDEARELIIAFASTVRHGLIPNLLDSGRKPRYNARDACWWFIRAVKDYCEHSSEGLAFLSTAIPLRFPKNVYVDWNDPSVYKTVKSLADILFDILDHHANGTTFWEWNAGPQLDDLMQHEGFNIHYGVDFRTGFIHGGNPYNCGTWMDKMGNSYKAGNRGVPSTPRDGSAIEIIALSKLAVDWFHDIHLTGFFPHDGVFNVKESRHYSWHSWSTLINYNFERIFWINNGSSPPTII